MRDFKIAEFHEVWLVGGLNIIKPLIGAKNKNLQKISRGTFVAESFELSNLNEFMNDFLEVVEFVK